MGKYFHRLCTNLKSGYRKKHYFVITENTEYLGLFILLIILKLFKAKMEIRY